MRTISITTLLIISLFSLSAQNIETKEEHQEMHNEIQKFNQFYHFLNASYVDTINNSRLIEAAIKQVLFELDPHSAYISADDMKGVEESFDGSFSGIGVEFNILNDTLIVVNTISGGPSESIGVMPNDKIVAIDGKDVIGIKQTEVPKYLRGPKGSVVEIEIERRGESERLYFRIVRDNIPLNTVDAAYKISPEIGYVRINRFANTTSSELTAALESFGEFNSLILDLRGNGGGLLEQSALVSENFLPQGAVIVSTEGRLVPSMDLKARKNGEYIKENIIVLIDESSASASEIVAGAIQDWDRGVIIGRRSFGKGLVQRQFKLQDGSAARVTIARYHTPTGRVIQRPFVKGDKDGYYEALNKRFEKGHVDSLSKIDSLRYKTLREQRDVYAGGGIYPDIYVDIDTTGYTKYWANLVRRGVINEYVILYMDRHRADLTKSYKTFNDYERKFKVSNKMIGELVDLGETKGINRDEEAMKISEADIKLQLKAIIAQKLWSMNEYFRVRNNTDNVVIKAKEVFKDWGKDDITKSISGF